MVDIKNSKIDTTEIVASGTLVSADGTVVEISDDKNGLMVLDLSILTGLIGKEIKIKIVAKEDIITDED